MITVVLPTYIPRKGLHLTILNRIINLENGYLNIHIQLYMAYDTVLFVGRSRLKSLYIGINASLLFRNRRNSKSRQNGVN